MKEGAKVTVELANKCSVKKAIAGTERGKRDQIKKARKHSFKFGEYQALGVWLCVCACVYVHM